MDSNESNEQIKISQVTSVNEIVAIKILQEENLKKNISEDEAACEGFVSAEYTLDFLKHINKIIPSIIAMNGSELVGYSLIITRESGDVHDLLNDLIQSIDTVSYKGSLLSNRRYVLGGQLCIKKGYRGRGLPQRLYAALKEATHKEFDMCVTDVAQSNPRSLKAHLRAGFQVVDAKTYGGLHWDIVLLDYNQLLNV